MSRPPAKPPLITPSASPPTTSSLFETSHRIPDQASPPKRPRLAVAARLSQAQASTTSSSTDQDLDIHHAREESKLRLFDVWSNLAERYTRALDEDDIIDITTGKVVRDRGVIRGSKTWHFGHLTRNPDDEAEEGDEDDEDEEDDTDELDTITNPVDDADGQDEGVEAPVAPPVTAMDAADAQDLQEFLEAERKRKELCGSEPEDTEESVDGESSADEHFPETSEAEYLVFHPHSSDGLESDGFSNVDADDTSRSNTNPPPQRRATSIFPFSDESDDELVNYDLDETSIVYPLFPKVEDDDSDSDVQIIKNPRPVTPSTRMNIKSASKADGASNPRDKPTGLQTPPQSYTSSGPSMTPSDVFSSMPPSSPVIPHFTSSPIKPPVQRQKPPPQRARSVIVGSVPGPPPIPRLDLAKLRNAKAIPRIESMAGSTSKELLPKAGPSKILGIQNTSASEPPSDAAVSTSDTSGKSKEAVRTPSRTKVEVVIERRKPLQGSRTQTAAAAIPLANPVHGNRAAFSKKPTSKAAKSMVAPVDNRSTSTNPPKIGPSALASTSRLPRRKSAEPIKSPVVHAMKGDGTPRPISSSKADHAGMVKRSPPNARTRKRKRVAFSTSDMSNESTPVPTPEKSLSKADSSPVIRSSRISPSASETGSHDENPRVNAFASSDTLDGSNDVPSQRSRQDKAPRPRARSLSRPYELLEEPPSNSSAMHSQSRNPALAFTRAQSHSHFGASDIPYHPYTQQSYAPLPPPHMEPRFYTPIPDPRVQFVITQAMQQLSALVGGTWMPPPPHATHPRGSTSYPLSFSLPYPPSATPDSSASLYSTPTHHPHPYPYSYDPSSSGTIPPDSPEPSSSSPAAQNGSARHPSLVARSRSRGRRVSFRIEEESLSDIMEMRSSPGPSSMTNGHSNSLSRKEKGKGKAKADPVESDDSDFEPFVVSRGRSYSRGRTPGPPDRAPTKSKRR